MARGRIAVFDPSSRLLAELRGVASGIELVALPKPDAVADCAALVIPPPVAADLGPATADGAPRWVIERIAIASRPSRPRNEARRC